MAAPIWQPGTLYPTGSIVQPQSAVTPTGAPIVNPNITGSATGWNLASPWVYDAGTTFSPGSGSLKFNTGFSGFASAIATAGIPVTPGTSITASCMCQQGASAAGNLALNVELFWYDSGDVFISNNQGNIVNSGSGGAWISSSVTAVAPAGAAFVRIGASGNRVAENLPAWVDNFQWNYVSAGLPAGLVFKAVQPSTGTSGGSEPVWPNTIGVQVVDNTVIWEAIAATRVTWEANPIMKSGATEPAFPTVLGGEVVDNNMRWVAVERRVTDPNCPQSKVVTFGASKIFAGDGDIVRYCATVNPLDWSSENNAGYLPVGLQQVSAINVTVLNQYRSNLVPFTPTAFQNWQIDPDPENMAYLDGLAGVGSIFQKAAQPVINDLFYLSPLGVRSIGISAGSTNLAAGDVGQPVDPLVRPAMRVAAANGSPVLGMYSVGLGQYWLSFSDYPPAALSLSGDLVDGDVGDTGTYAYEGAGGVKPYTFTIDSGSLPPGATLGTDGVVTFDYSSPGLFSWVVKMVDSSGMDPAFLPDSNLVRVNGPWFYGPVNQNGIGGGPQNYYLKTLNPKNWAGAPIVLPNGMSSIKRISTANGVVFFHGGTVGVMASVSYDGGDNFEVCDNQLAADADVYWNGTRYYQGNLQSDNGKNWVAITNNPATAVGGTAFARDSDGVIIIADSIGRVHVSVNHGANWTPKTLPFSAPVSASMETNGTRISASMPSGVGFGYTDNLFTSVTNVPGTGFTGYTAERNGTFIGRAGALYRRSTTLQAGSFTDILSGQGAVGNTARVVAHSDEQWCCLKQISSTQFRVNVADDDGLTWEEGTQILYGNGGNIAYPRGG
jgi:hypothetical protein